MQTVQPSMLGRSDTMLGICQSLGEDFGISPNWLRVAFGVGVIFNIEYAIGAYLAVGVLVLASRLLFPSRRTAVTRIAPVVTTEPVAATPVIHDEELVLAAAA